MTPIANLRTHARRLTARRLMTAVALTGVLAGGAGLAPAYADEPTAPATLAAGGVGFGASTPTPQNGDVMESLSLFEKSVGRRVDVVNTFKKWGGPSGTFANARAELLATSLAGRSPMVTWEPMPASGTSVYSVQDIAAGVYDSYIDSWADGLRDLGSTVYLRPMHEMNGNWYSWSGDPAGYIAAWQHIRDHFRAEGADNVQFVWTVNADDVPYNNLFERYWPGSGYVDVLGMDGYNCYAGWRTFDAIFKRAYGRITALDSTLPVWVVETGSCEPAANVTNSTGRTKAEWLRGLYASTLFPRMRMVMFFDEKNTSGYDWRVASSATALAELKTQLRAANGWVAPPAAIAPPRPAGLTVTTDGDGMALVNWQAATSYLVGYKLLVKAPDAANYTSYTLPKTATNYMLTGLTPGASYKVTMQAYTAAALSLLADPVYYAVPARSLAAPKSFTATATQTRVTLKWAAVPDATEYRIVAADGSLLAVTTALTWTSGLFDPSTPWSYAVRAADEVVVSAESIRISGVTTSATPTGVVVTLVDGKPQISWNAVTGATGYRVVRDGTLIGSVLAPGTALTDGAATTGSTYGYSVASYNANSQSGRMAPTMMAIP